MKWKLAPIEPANEMLDAAMEFTQRAHLGGVYHWSNYVTDIYQVMLSAAPNPLDDAELVERVARAIFLDETGGDWETCSDYMRRACTGQARAAIAAMMGGE